MHNKVKVIGELLQPVEHNRLGMSMWLWESVITNQARNVKVEEVSLPH